MSTSKKRETWIDTIKSICIICVYIAHCESFYLPTKYVATFIVTPFYVNTFFFISGYLLFRKQFNNNRIENYTLKKEYKEDLCNILFRLAIPTIIFSAIIYIPKNHGTFDFDGFIYNIFGGTSFWFTSAICISQIAIYTLLLSKRKNIWFYVGCTLLITVITTEFGDVRSKPAEEYFPWYWQTGLIYTFLIILGGVYCKYENRINDIISKPMTQAIAIGSLSTIMAFVWNGTEMLCLGLSGKSNIMGYIAILSSITILIYIAKAIPKSKATEFIGRQSIILYFLSGAVPSTLLYILRKIQPENSLTIFILYTVLSFVISYIITLIIAKYIPTLTDLRKIYKKNG